MSSLLLLLPVKKFWKEDILIFVWKLILKRLSSSKSAFRDQLPLKALLTRRSTFIKSTKRIQKHLKNSFWLFKSHAERAFNLVGQYVCLAICSQYRSKLVWYTAQDSYIANQKLYFCTAEGLEHNEQHVLI